MCDPLDTGKMVIIATGASAKHMGLKGEDTYWQSGILACAVCDAAEEATYLTKYGSHAWLHGDQQVCAATGTAAAVNRSAN